MAEPLLSVENVTREFGDRVKSRVLHGVSLQLMPGELSALIGPSGSGKSTLLHIMGLLDRPTEGRVVIAGKEASRLDDVELTRLRGRALGFVFQFHHLLPAFTALENVMMPAWADRGLPDRALRARATELLTEVGLGKKLDAKSRDLSGGEAQRVAIARALGNDPPLVLADEPTGNLDTQTADEVFALLRRFNRQQNKTFLVITHDVRLAARCDRILRLVDGRIVSDLRRGDPAPEGTFAPIGEASPSPPR
ncbi:MAG: ABC transporter ATP-binding protein [Byssovorax sp.]